MTAKLVKLPQPRCDKIAARVLRSAMKEVRAGRLREIVIVGTTNSGHHWSGWSTGRKTEMLGNLTRAQFDINNTKAS